MRKPVAILGSAVFFVVVPCAIAGLVPWWITRWQFRDPFLGTWVTQAVGVTLIVAGLPGLVDSIRRFAVEGFGTPAPVAPTQILVVTGFYRHVRNPMYLSVLAIILGRGLLFGDWRLVAYGAAFWTICHLFVIAYEEPTLHHAFSAEYEAYQRNVPRWLPRLTPWRKG
ncbi:methyltransferase family protein [Sinorhizobium fredii]|uniref:methyltransferase family protein n=1 Tax=Rhizobium fredii TaxID=380 RepID=UPI00210C0789|nr:isoprenylcysteine carboxylmethyltransferase family protein [Sinorhizobium fredii]UTY49884.1 isoprenylcysteine carboxylmethyltransferase family protein [Sinorhizobium fredii]